MYHTPRDPESWCVKGTNESTLDNNLSPPLIQHELSDPEFLSVHQRNQWIYSYTMMGLSK